MCFFTQISAIIYLINYKHLLVNDTMYIYPDWAYALGWMMTFSTLAVAALFVITQLCLTPGTFKEVSIQRIGVHAGWSLKRFLHFCSFFQFIQVFFCWFPAYFRPLLPCWTSHLVQRNCWRWWNSCWTDNLCSDELAKQSQRLPKCSVKYISKCILTLESFE